MKPRSHFIILKINKDNYPFIHKIFKIKSQVRKKFKFAAICSAYCQTLNENLFLIHHNIAYLFTRKQGKFLEIYITNMPDLFPLCSPWVFFALFMHCMHFLFLPSIRAETYWFGGTAWFSLESCSIYAFAFIARNHRLLVLVCEVKFEIKCFALQSNTFWFKNKSITKKYIKKKPKYVSIPLFWLPSTIHVTHVRILNIWNWN